jgi:hypothetical protein
MKMGAGIADSRMKHGQKPGKPLSFARGTLLLYQQFTAIF